MSKYVLLAERIKEVLSLIIGPSKDILEAISPMEPCP